MKKVNCLVLEKEEIENIIRPHLIGPVSVDKVCRRPYFDTFNPSDQHHNKFFFDIVGKHFGVKVSDMHCVECDDTIGHFEVWVECEDIEVCYDVKYDQPIVLSNTYDLISALRDMKVDAACRYIRNIKVEHEGELYSLNNLYIECENVYLRPIELMTKEDKIEADISYAEEADCWSLSELIKNLEEHHEHYDNLGIGLDIEGEQSLTCSIQVKDNIAIIKIA